MLWSIRRPHLDDALKAQGRKFCRLRSIRFASVCLGLKPRRVLGRWGDWIMGRARERVVKYRVPQQQLQASVEYTAASLPQQLDKLRQIQLTNRQKYSWRNERNTVDSDRLQLGGPSWVQCCHVASAVKKEGGKGEGSRVKWKGKVKWRCLSQSRVFILGKWPFSLDWVILLSRKLKSNWPLCLWLTCLHLTLYIWLDGTWYLRLDLSANVTFDLTFNILLDVLPTLLLSFVKDTTNCLWTLLQNNNINQRRRVCTVNKRLIQSSAVQLDPSLLPPAAVWAADQSSVSKFSRKCVNIFFLTDLCKTVHSVNFSLSASRLRWDFSKLEVTALKHWSFLSDS